MKIKNWKKFQHYNKRMPPWIKVYRELLNDPDWHALEPMDAKVLIMLWILACDDEKMEGTLPAIDVIAFRLRLDSMLLASCLQRLKCWINGVEDGPASKPLARCYQHATPETEAEAELLAKDKEPTGGLFRLDDDFTSDSFGKMVNTKTGEIK